MKKIALIIALILINFSSYAETDLKKIEFEIKNLARSESFINKTVDQYGLTGMTRKVFKEHVKELYKKDEVIDLLVREMRIAGLDRAKTKNDLEYGRAFGTELILSYAMKGLSRLSLEEQRSFINYLYNLLSVASLSDCKKILMADDSASAHEIGLIEIKYYDRLKKEQLENYFSILRKAIISEINDFPNKKTLNSEQIKIADNAFEHEITKKVNNGLISDEIARAIIDMPNSNDKDVCSAGMIIFKTIYEMKGFAGDLMVTKIMAYMQ